ncbi:response regulator [Methanospirillum lacunae]|uniref:Two-component system response regulator n=1 Tax=Methanospirillum lacunae TaxID=668570 RepID=A0A2V2NF53_9EURY|nr:response regulator [Methanospirillum lacunae]PWR74221.1 two-component system response regulator [Methanospirillum lacunae]
MVKILIVDDNLFMRTMIKTFVSDAGFEISAMAVDGYQGVYEYTQNRPDIVLLDILMPKMDGIMALKTLIAYDPHARILMVSAIQSVKMIKLAITCGAKGYVLKPFQREQLIQEINRVLELNL